MTIADRIKALRKRLGLTQDAMAARLGVSRSYVWMLEKGDKPGGPKVQRAIEWLEQSSPPAPGASGKEIMRSVQLSQPRFISPLTLAQAGSAMVSWESLPPDWDKVPTDADDPAAFAIEARGDSMEPYIRAGDKLVMLPSKPPANGDIVVARFRNGDTVLKIYHESDGGQTIHLTSYNTEYPPNTYQRTEFEAIVPADTLIQKLRPGMFR